MTCAASVPKESGLRQVGNPQPVLVIALLENFQNALGLLQLQTAINVQVEGTLTKLDRANARVSALLENFRTKSACQKNRYANYAPVGNTQTLMGSLQIENAKGARLESIPLSLDKYLMTIAMVDVVLENFHRKLV